MTYLGDYPTGATVRIPWNTNGTSGASITRAVNGTVRIYKDSSNVERTSASGVTDNEDWDGNTGLQLLTIDLSDNTDAGFYAAGHDYQVAVTGQTIDGLTVSVFIGAFSIENRFSSGGSAPTASEIATAVWQDLLASGDFGIAASIGKLLKDDIDAAISSRLATAGYTTPPTVGAIADQVWDEAIAGHLGAGSTGASLNAAGSAGDPWATAVPGAYAGGSAGFILGTNLDALVSSRMATFTLPANFSSLVIDANGRVKALVGITQNVAFTNFQFYMSDSAGDPVTGLVNGDFSLKKYSIDTGVNGTIAGTITEVDATDAPGFYRVDLTAAELNGRNIALEFLATGTVRTVLSIFPSQ